jgi:signal transduction histidine kinase
MKSTRVFQLTALVLMAVAALEVAWWQLDQRHLAIERANEAHTLYAQEVSAAQALLDSGTSAARIQQMLPDIAINNGKAALSPEADHRLLTESYHHINRYLWEGSFFLLVLSLCIGVIARALRAEAQVIKEQDNFLALVSHQFKTPLASLQLSLETMAMRQLAPEQQRTLIDRMLSDLARMEAMVTQILESVRLERGRVDLRSEPIELGSAVARVVSQFEERATKDHIAITTDIMRGLHVQTDPLALDVIVRNLLENALAAVVPVGGGTIAVAARKLGDEIQLTVRDTGVGFRPADGTRLFEKFTRLHPGGGGSYYGTGLGLFIVSRLMQLAGGRVSAHSDGVGQGAQFVLTWPIASATLQGAGPRS